MTSPSHRIEVSYKYPPELRTRYREGKLFPEWYEKYHGAPLFYKKMFTSRQIPHSGPILTGDPLFFNELFLGTQYLDAGYGALFNYRQVEDLESYRRACEILGGEEAAQFITPNNESGGRAPDLLVYDLHSLRFRFVECKRPGEPLTEKQPGKFAEIEEFLNKTLPNGTKPLTDKRHEKLFPDLPPGQWIHIARMEPR